MVLRAGDEAPNFTAKTTEGIIDFHQWAGNKWVIFFIHIADSDSVRAIGSERGARLKQLFDVRGVKMIAISADEGESPQEGIFSHETQKTGFPLIADEEKVITAMYDIIYPYNQTVPTLFIIAPDKKIKLIVTYSASSGINFNELIRVIESLQANGNHGESKSMNLDCREDYTAIRQLHLNKLQDVSEGY